MSNILKKLWLILVIGIVIYASQSCEKDEVEKKEEVNWDKEANKQLLKVMKEYYYWYELLPTVNPVDYQDPTEFIEALAVNPPDKWSYVTTKQEQDAYYNAGAYYGFGFGSAFDQDGKLWIIYTFNSSPLAQKGIKRGWKISTIDGVTPTPENFNQLIGESKAGISKTFGFNSPEGNSVSHTFTKIEVVMNTVLFDSVYTINSKKIAYLVLNGFINPTKTELERCFSTFKSANIADLIVDLRYNGGGLVDVSNLLASLIGGIAANGGIYGTYYHNNKNTFRNNSIYFKTLPSTVSLSRVTFITTHGTASASELLINGLKPFMGVSLVGSKTHGKPVGMYSFEYKEFDWVFVPICFSIRNAKNEGDFFDGINVTVEAGDDITKPFGDFREASFAAALSHLGVLPSKGIMAKTSLQTKLITGKGLYEEIGAW